MNAQPTSELSREEINQLTGAVVLEFGTEWCEYCQAAQSLILSSLTLQAQRMRYLLICTFTLFCFYTTFSIVKKQLANGIA